jgi:hypothetical protein
MAIMQVYLFVAASNTTLYTSVAEADASSFTSDNVGALATASVSLLGYALNTGDKVLLVIANTSTTAAVIATFSCGIDITLS